MASAEHLWKKGQSGNPSGRPKKGKSLTDILEKHGKKRDVTDGEKLISRKEALAKKLWSLALIGDVPAIKYIFDRIDGKPEITGNINYTGMTGIIDMELTEEEEKQFSDNMKTLFPEVEN